MMYTGTEHWYMDKQQRKEHVRFSRTKGHRQLSSLVLKRIGMRLYHAGCRMERTHLNIQMS
jgi:hypothetical protein